MYTKCNHYYYQIDSHVNILSLRTYQVINIYFKDLNIISVHIFVKNLCFQQIYFSNMTNLYIKRGSVIQVNDLVPYMSKHIA